MVSFIIILLRYPFINEFLLILPNYILCKFKTIINRFNLNCSTSMRHPPYRSLSMSLSMMFVTYLFIYIIYIYIYTCRDV